MAAFGSARYARHPAMLPAATGDEPACAAFVFGPEVLTSVDQLQAVGHERPPRTDAAAADPMRSTLAWWLLLVFATFAVASPMLSAPLLPGDEYAFLVSGVFYDRLDDVRLLDPWLQPVTNFLFFGLIHLVRSIAGDNFVPVFRLVHAAELILSAIVLHRTARAVLGGRDALTSVLLFLLLPSGMYVFAVMPEMELVLASACIAFTMVVVLPRRPVIATLAAGLLIGVALLMKPHAVAILLAVLAVVMVTPWLDDKPGRVSASVRAGVLLLLSSYLTVIVLWRLFHPTWAFDPRLPLGLALYGEAVGGAVGGLSIGRKILETLGYAAAHLDFALLLFAPALVWCSATVAATVRERRRQGQRRQAQPGSAVSLALFALAMLLSHVAMTAWFSAGVGSSNEGEALRLHGRYLGPALSLLPCVYLLALRRQPRWAVILSSALGVLAVIGFVGLVRPAFKIFPWDHPLLFAYFSAPNHYGWNFEGSGAAIGVLLPWIVLVLYAAAMAFKTVSRRALLLQLSIVLLVGNLQSYAWVYRQSLNNRPLANSARAISTLLGDDQFGKGMVVTASRYGDGATLLFGLANAPRVLFREAGSTITAQDVGGAAWIVLGDKYRTDFDAAQSMALGPLRFFPLDSSAAVHQGEKRILDVGATRTISLAAGHFAPGRLSGFNPQEEWGAWTAGGATIELPFRVEGTIKLSLGGWALAENLGKPLKLAVGEDAVDLPLTATGALHELTMHVGRASDRIDLDSLSFETAPGHRLGVAIGSISLTRVAP